MMSLPATKGFEIGVDSMELPPRAPNTTTFEEREGKSGPVKPIGWRKGVESVMERSLFSNCLQTDSNGFANAKTVNEKGENTELGTRKA